MTFKSVISALTRLRTSSNIILIYKLQAQKKDNFPQQHGNKKKIRNWYEIRLH